MSVFLKFTEPPRLWKQIAVFTALLALLFAGLQPPPTAHLGFLVALALWSTHIGLGMLCALLAMRLVLAAGPRLARRPWTALLLGGLLGSILFAPLALVLEASLPAAPPEPADDWLDEWEAAGGVKALVAEWLSLLPSYLPAWLLINAMPMLQVTQQPAGEPGQGHMQPRAHTRGEHGCEGAVGATSGVDPAPVLASSSGLYARAEDIRQCAAAALGGAEPLRDTTPAECLDAPEGVLDRLPLAIGRQLVSISSDLHYLQVVTRRGRATLLGSLSEAESELGARGLRIHRSHWVALDAIRRLRRNTQGWRCELLDGRSLPVSRRRAVEIKQQLGTDFVVED